MASPTRRGSQAASSSFADQGGPSGLGNLTLHSVIDDEDLLAAFLDFTVRYHAEESLAFWICVEVFRHRNWKAAKFFGMDEGDGKSKTKRPPPPSSQTSNSNVVKAADNGGSSAGAGGGKPGLLRRLSKSLSSDDRATIAAQERAENAEKARLSAKQAAAQQRQLDELAATRMGISLEQLYVVKEADWICETFLQRGSPQWICVDATVTEKVEKALAAPASVTRAVFAEAQALAWATMSEDLLPRFLKEVTSADPRSNADVAALQARVEELRRGPARRKTGVSTALAFSFRQRTVSRTVRDHQQQQTQADTVSQLPNGKASQQQAGAMRAATLLRTHSSMIMLSAESASVETLALSRARLSVRTSTRSVGTQAVTPPRQAAAGGGEGAATGANASDQGPKAFATHVASSGGVSIESVSSPVAMDRHVSMPMPGATNRTRTNTQASVRRRAKSESAVVRHKRALDTAPRRTALLLGAAADRLAAVQGGGANTRSVRGESS